MAIKHGWRLIKFEHVDLPRIQSIYKFNQFDQSLLDFLQLCLYGGVLLGESEIAFFSFQNVSKNNMELIDSELHPLNAQNGDLKKSSGD